MPCVWLHVLQVEGFVVTSSTGVIEVCHCFYYVPTFSPSIPIAFAMLM